MSLASGTADIVQMPCYGFPMYIDVKCVLGNSHGLDARVENVIFQMVT